MSLAALTLFSVLNIALLNLISTKETRRSNTSLRGISGVTSVESNIFKVDMSMKIPSILYGTAWKKDRTKDLVIKAIQSGFRGIDTACQPKHYNEAGVGEALKYIFNEGLVTRNQLFIQTKFTSIDGQDPNNIPYDKMAPLSQQVEQSFAKSCQNLGTSYLDSLVLHSPMQTFEDTMIVWRTLEGIYNRGGIKAIGISNTYDLRTLRRLYESATIKPSFLQNRFYQKSGYDKDIRAFCKEHGIQYQSFWSLTANPHILSSSSVTKLVRKYSKTREQIFFRFLQTIGIVPLTGTTSQEHMTEDLAASEFSLDPSEVEELNALLV